MLALAFGLIPGACKPSSDTSLPALTSVATAARLLIPLEVTYKQYARVAILSIGGEGKLVIEPITLDIIGAGLSVLECSGINFLVMYDSRDRTRSGLYAVNPLTGQTTAVSTGIGAIPHGRSVVCLDGNLYYLTRAGLSRREISRAHDGGVTLSDATNIVIPKPVAISSGLVALDHHLVFVAGDVAVLFDPREPNASTRHALPPGGKAWVVWGCGSFAIVRSYDTSGIGTITFVDTPEAAAPTEQAIRSGCARHIRDLVNATRVLRCGDEVLIVENMDTPVGMEVRAVVGGRRSVLYGVKCGGPGAAMGDEK